MKGIVCFISVLIFLSCSSKDEKDQTKQSKEKKEVVLKDVTLSFHGIELGQNIKKIPKSAMKNDPGAKLGYLDVYPSLDMFTTGLEEFYKDFYAEIVTDNNNKLNFETYVCTKDNNVSKILCLASGVEYYDELKQMFVSKYGEIHGKGIDRANANGTYNCNYVYWDFKNDKRLYLWCKKCKTDLDLPKSWLELAEASQCIIISYCDMKPFYEMKQLEEKAQKEAEEKKRKEKTEENNRRKKVNKSQDF